MWKKTCTLNTIIKYVRNKSQINEAIHYVHESEDSMLSTNLSKDLMQLQSKSQ